MDNVVREQILKVRDTALTNMFDINVVQRIAFEMELFELVNFIDEQPKDYVNFIIHGE